MNPQDYLLQLQKTLSLLDVREIDDAVALIGEAWERESQIITLGNGGSAATALHFIADWNKSLSLSGGKAFRGRSLVENTGLLTAWANDVSYDDVFVAQLRYVMRPGDLAVLISGSGNSENVIRAAEYANANGGVTLGLCGYNGGRLKGLAHHTLHVPVDDMQLAEDIHAIFGHIVLRALGAYSAGALPCAETA
jgi:D-sedoheptulose 7-phosphate isomerase